MLARYAQAAGRDPSTITTALQSIVCPGDTPEQARERFENSAFDLFRVSLQKIIGSRSPERVAAAAASCAEAAAFLGAGVPVRGMTNAEAAQAADVVIAAVPWEGHASLLTSLPAPLAAVASWGVNRPW